MTSSSSSRISRPYYYNKKGLSCAAPPVERQTRSYVQCDFLNSFGENWQEVTDKLHSMGCVHGPIVKIILTETNNNQYVSVKIYYEKIASAKNFVDQFGIIKNFFKVEMFTNVIHGEM